MGTFFDFHLMSQSMKDLSSFVSSFYCLHSVDLLKVGGEVLKERGRSIHGHASDAVIHKLLWRHVRLISTIHSLHSYVWMALYFAWFGRWLPLHGETAPFKFFFRFIYPFITAFRNRKKMLSSLCLD